MSMKAALALGTALALAPAQALALPLTLQNPQATQAASPDEAGDRPGTHEIVLGPALAGTLGFEYDFAVDLEFGEALEFEVEPVDDGLAQEDGSDEATLLMERFRAFEAAHPEYRDALSDLIDEAGATVLGELVSAGEDSRAEIATYLRQRLASEGLSTDEVEEATRLVDAYLASGTQTVKALSTLTLSSLMQTSEAEVELADEAAEAIGAGIEGTFAAYADIAAFDEAHPGLTLSLEDLIQEFNASAYDRVADAFEAASAHLLAYVDELADSYGIPGADLQELKDMMCDLAELIDAYFAQAGDDQTLA